jgi:hypothetical protein
MIGEQTQRMHGAPEKMGKSTVTPTKRKKTQRSTPTTSGTALSEFLFGTYVGFQRRRRQLGPKVRLRYFSRHSGD